MKKLTFSLFNVLLFFLFLSASFAQERQVVIQNGKEMIFVDGLPLLTKEDSIFQASVPVLKLPKPYFAGKC